MAFHAGALWRRRQEDETARVGGDVTKGAIKGGLARSKHDLADKLLWARDDRRLEEEFGITSGRKRAEKLGRDHKVKTETFRKEVGKLRRETDPEK